MAIEWPKPILWGIDVAEGASIQIGIGGDVNDIYTNKLVNQAVPGDFNMVKDGSITPVLFKVLADPDFDIVLSELRMVFCANALDFGGSDFGKGGGVLPNGMLINGVLNDGHSVALLNVKQNQHMLEFATVTGLNTLTEFAGTSDVIISSFQFGGRAKLAAGSADELSVTIRDSLLGGTRDIRYLQATAYGFFRDPLAS